MAAYASLENTKLFPPWRNLPFVNDKHSIFLANIQEFDGFLRYRTVVKDRDGELCIVAFYPDSYEGFDFHQLKRDHTLAIVNAVQHHFVDGTHGVRVESMHDVCVRSKSHQAGDNLEEAEELIDRVTGSYHQSASNSRTVSELGQGERTVGMPWL